MEKINGYTLTTELKNDNSGFARWGFAVKGTTEYFIKEFLSPIYPVDGDSLSEAQLMRKRKICEDFETEKRHFYNILNSCSTGNIVTVADFFRHGNKYYIVTEKIDAAPIALETMARMPEDQKILIVRIILHCINSLHKHGIVHGDIKPDNILFKKTPRGMYTAKIIDFDSSFLESNAPVDEELQGDMVYLAPESFLLMATGEAELTVKIDVFALGVLFHAYFSGKLPGFDSEKYNYVFESVLDGNEPDISESVPENMKEIIRAMLKLNPDDRPTIDEIFESLTPGMVKRAEKSTTENISPPTPPVSIPKTPPVYTTSRLKSTMPNMTASTIIVHREEPEKTPEPTAEKPHPEGFFKKADELL